MKVGILLLLGQCICICFYLGIIFVQEKAVARASQGQQHGGQDEASDQDQDKYSVIIFPEKRAGLLYAFLIVYTGRTLTIKVIDYLSSISICSSIIFIFDWHNPRIRKTTVNSTNFLSFNWYSRAVHTFVIHILKDILNNSKAYLPLLIERGHWPGPLSRVPGSRSIIPYLPGPSQMSVGAGWPCFWVLAFCAGCSLAVK